ncbi:hypothetical protein ACQKCU_25045 [Heyndrickxia sporothermodurans]
MTTIANSLNMFNAFSVSSRQVTQSMNMTISVMERLSSTSRQSTESVRIFTMSQRQLSISSQMAAQGQVRLNNQMQQGNSKAKSLLGNIKDVVSNIKNVASVTIGKGMDQQQMIDTISARTGSQKMGNGIYQTLRKDALKFGQDVDTAVKGGMSFLSQTQDPMQLKELNRLSMRLSKLNPAEGLEGAASSLKQLSSGDYSSMAEQFNINPNLLKNSDAMKAGQNGDIEGFISGMDDLLNKQNLSQSAFENMLDSPVAKWDSTLNTFNDSISQVGLSALSAFTPFFDLINNAASNDQLNPLFAILSVILQGIGTILTGITSALLTVFDVVAQYWPVIAGMLLALLAIYLPTIVIWLWGMIQPILAQAGAWMLANLPILAVIIAIGLLIFILMQCGVTAEQIVGAIIGAFYALYASVYNIIGNICNGFLMLAEFIANLFIDPVYAIKKLFYDMIKMTIDNMAAMAGSFDKAANILAKVFVSGVNIAIGAINSLINLLNKIPGIKIGTIGKVSGGSVSNISGALTDFASNLKPPTSDKNVVDFGKYKMNLKSIPNAYNQGYKTGSNMVSNMGDKFNSLKNNDLDKLMKDKKISDNSFPNNSIPGSSIPRNSIPNNSIPGSSMPSNAISGVGNGKNEIPKVGKVDEVDKINKSVDISSEDLKMLRELAEIKNIQNFVTLTPTVQVTTGDIKSESDIDKIIAQIENRLTNEVKSTAQGVYG